MGAVDFPYAIRPVGPESVDAVIANDQLVFAEVFPEAVVEIERALLPWERSLAVFDGDELVGFTAAFEFPFAVPGAVHPVADGVTWVGVRTTHRRRGILNELMRRQLTDLHERGQSSVAVLWASEPSIYGRFGYGLASSKYELTIPRGAALVGVPTDPAIKLRLADPDKTRDTLAEVCAAATAGRPGVPGRHGDWWRRVTLDPPASRGGGKLYCVLAEDETGVRGYALYIPRGKWEPSGPAGTLTVREIVARDTAAYASLWRYLLDVDLMATVEHWNLPVDDPLLYWLADLRRAQPRLSDSLYVRLIDVGSALAGRTYSADINLVLDVSDPFCHWNAGRWRLAGDASGAECTPTTDAADLALDVRTLASAYLGGVPLRELGRAGRVTELRPGALSVADRAFASDVAPWCPFIF